MISEAKNISKNHKFIDLTVKILINISDFLGTSVLRMINKLVTNLLIIRNTDVLKYRYVTKLIDDQQKVEILKEHSESICYLSFENTLINNDLFKIANFSNLVSLNIGVDVGYPRYSSDLLNVMNSFLDLAGNNKFNYLLDLELNFSGKKFEQYINNLEREKIKNIKKLSNLNKLTLRFAGRHINEEYMSLIMEAISGPNINQLELDFGNAKFYPNTIRPLMYKLTHLTKLHKLYLQLYFAERINKNQIKHFNILSECKELRELYINLHHTYKNTKVALRITEIAKKMDPINAAKLKFLGFSVGFNQFSDLNIKQFKQLAAFQYLTKLFIDLSNLYLQYEQIQALSFIKHLKYLKNLRLFIDNSVLSDGDIKILSNINLSKQLSDIYLSLSNNKITDQGAMYLARYMSEISSLSLVKLNLNNNIIKDDGALQLLTAFKEHNGRPIVSLELLFNPIKEAASMIELVKYNPNITLDITTSNFNEIEDDSNSLEASADNVDEKSNSFLRPRYKSI